MRKPPIDTKATRELAKERTHKQVERYYTKLALAKTWEKHHPQAKCIERLKREAEKLRAKLIVKGVL